MTDKEPLIAPASPPLTGESKKDILFAITAWLDEIFCIKSREVVE
jgi:hypothetical protein